MNIQSFITITLGTVIPTSSREIFTPVSFFPPDLSGNATLSPGDRLIFHDGDSVELTAPVRYEGKDFLRWHVKENGILIQETMENPLTITIRNHTEVMAIYEALSMVSWAQIIIGLQSLPQSLPINSFVELTSV